MWLLDKSFQLLSANNLVRKVNHKFKTTMNNTLRTGILPNHVAFIMDGNRRFAVSNGLDKLEGHEAGSVSLAKIIETSFLLGIKYVTIYAFSIENFKRTKEEIDRLLELLIEKLNVFLKDQDELNKCVQVRIIGNRSFIPAETLEKLEQIEEITSKNDQMILNVCFSYTSRDEITKSIGKTMELVSNEELLINQIDEKTLEDNFYFGTDIPKVDLLIRTSGHTRLSDFLIWQVNNSRSIIEFSNVNWPDFSDLEFYSLLLKYGYDKLVNDKFKEIKEKFIPVLYNYAPTEVKEIQLGSLPDHPPLISILGTE